MDFKLFSSERRKPRIAVIAIMAGYFIYQGWWVIHTGFPGNLETLLKFKSFVWALTALILPISAVIGIYRQKPWGIASIWFWIFIRLYGIGNELAVFGPTFASPEDWVSLLLIFLLFLLIGNADLWYSLFYTPLGKKPSMPLWLNKTIQVIFASLLVGSPLFMFLFAGIKAGFSSPELTTYQDKHTISDGKSPLLPFGYQFDLPLPMEVFSVDPIDGSMILKVGKTLWTLESKNLFNETVKDYGTSPRFIHKFLAAKYGIVPQIIKSGFFGEKPDKYFEIKQKGLWGAVSIERLENKEAAAIHIFLWDDAGAPLGAIRAIAVSISPPDWNWVDSLQRTPPLSWSPEKFEKMAKNYSAKGQTGLEGFYLASAVVADKDKPPRLKALIEYFEKHGFGSHAKYQLEEAIKDFPQSQLLKTIKIADLPKK